MGLFSFKKSTSVTQATTNNTGFSELSEDAVAISGSGNTVNRLDGGAIASAFDFAGKVSSESAGIAGELARDSIAIAAGATAKAVSDESDKLVDLFKWVVGGAVVVAAALLMFRKGAA